MRAKSQTSVCRSISCDGLGSQMRGKAPLIQQQLTRYANPSANSTSGSRASAAALAPVRSVGSYESCTLAPAVLSQCSRTRLVLEPARCKIVCSSSSASSLGSIWRLLLVHNNNDIGKGKTLSRTGPQTTNIDTKYTRARGFDFGD